MAIWGCLSVEFVGRGSRLRGNDVRINLSTRHRHPREGGDLGLDAPPAGERSFRAISP